ncbi:MAG: hypothetical protein QNI97_00205 [Desulfobacterales bacterium]|nr:hypothetical protein [Desulfobacterales bacterium]MDJ0991718.1 hypothetical protein [Desulfobacterales bacterium]
MNLSFNDGRGESRMMTGSPKSIPMDPQLSGAAPMQRLMVSIGLRPGPSRGKPIAGARTA